MGVNIPDHQGDNLSRFSFNMKERGSDGKSKKCADIVIKIFVCVGEEGCDLTEGNVVPYISC